MKIVIIEDSTKKVIREIDVSKKDPRTIEKIIAGMNQKINLELFSIEKI